MLVSLVFSLYSKYSEVHASEPLNSSTNTTLFSICIKPWNLYPSSLKNEIYKEKYNRNIIVDINLSLDPVIEVGKYKDNTSLEDALFCKQITLSSYKNSNKSSFFLKGVRTYKEPKDKIFEIDHEFEL
jgi:hypothetical protein